MRCAEFILTSGFETDNPQKIFSEYQGKKTSHRGGPVSTRNKEAMKSRLEEAIMGQNSARSEMILRRRGNTIPNNAHVVGLSQFYIPGAGWCHLVK